VIWITNCNSYSCSGGSASWLTIRRREGASRPSFWADVQQRQDIRELLANPRLLSAVCISFNEGKRLPQDRHELYVRIIDTVLYATLPRHSLKSNLHRNRLGVIAYAMHTGEGLGESRSTPACGGDGVRGGPSVVELPGETTLLGRGPSEASLRHARSCCLIRGLARAPRWKSGGVLSVVDSGASGRAVALGPRGSRSWLTSLWPARRCASGRDTLSFAFGALLARSAEPTKAVQLLESLLERMTLESVRLQVVIADCLQVLLGRDIRLREPSQQKFREACLAAIDREVELADRHVLGLALGRIGDPRIVVDLRSHDSEAFVRIEAGEYAYQDGRQTIEHAFLLSRYPVTNSQYHEFMKGKGYNERRFWSDEGWAWKEQESITEPYYWRHPVWNVPNQPVVGVSWYEAEAFCRWAGGQLPSEQQWEAAARGAEGHAYPWGNTWNDSNCNNDQAGLRMTSAVGLFPRARTPEGGLEDMAGNVWEWCVGAFAWGEAFRVRRGGCWVFSAGDCRSVTRYWGRSDLRINVLGFRVSLIPVAGS
jgi:hypothetical protein